MANANDILSNFQDFELQFNDKTGDFAVGNSDQIHIHDLGISFIGHWREYPFAGVGVQRFNNAPIDLESLKREYRLQLEVDGYKILNLEVNNNKQISVNAERVVNESGI